MISIVTPYKNNKLLAYYYFALEEFVMDNLMERFNEPFFFTWQIKGVVIGKHQSLNEEINLEYAKENNVRIFRRPTGGGAIYADEGNFMFSIIKKEESVFSFHNELNSIIESLSFLKLHLTLSDRNDILLDGKKISGNAFLRKRQVNLLHGTFLYNTNMEVLSKVLTPKKAKYESKGVRSISSRVTNVSSYTDYGIHGIIDDMTKSLCSKTYVLTKEEHNIVKKLSRKYKAPAWIKGKDREYDARISGKTSFGSFDLLFTLHFGLIKRISMKGDYFVVNPINSLFVETNKVPFNRDSIINYFKSLNMGYYILNYQEEELIEVIDRFFS